MSHEPEYIEILADSLKKKLNILKEISRLSAEQKKLIQEERLDLEAFSGFVEKKGECIDTLNNLDSGFQKIFDRVKDILTEQPEEYKEQIAEMKRLIAEIMQLSMSIQAEEERNKEAIKAHFSKLKKEARQIKNSQQAIQSYYNTMNKIDLTDAQFLDKKK